MDVLYSSTYCSRACAHFKCDQPQPLKVPPPDQRSPERIAYEQGDAPAFFAAIRRKAVVVDAGCWVWQGQRTKDGYPLVKWSKKGLGVHRLVLEVKHGAPLGTQHAHHTCANAQCVNPDHLQPVTHAQNAAEMMARKSYLARIAELEDALRMAAPDHPALGLIPVS